MYQFFSKQDRWFSRCGHLEYYVVERAVEGAPAFLRGLRALFVSDVHVNAATTDADLSAFAERLASIAPDLLLWGGDFADRPEHAGRLLSHLSGVKAPLGSFGVLGNNDREAWPEIDALRAVMEGAGIRLLVNEAVELPVNGGTLTLAGIDEYSYGKPDARGLYGEAGAANRYSLLLSHFPVPPKVMPDLMLCGHTHGGQFNLLGVTPYTVGFERILFPSRAPRMIAGLHSMGGGQVLVSKGIGASRIPLRVGVRPEIELLQF